MSIAVAIRRSFENLVKSIVMAAGSKHEGDAAIALAITELAKQTGRVADNLGRLANDQKRSVDLELGVRRYD